MITLLIISNLLLIVGMIKSYNDFSKCKERDCGCGAIYLLGMILYTTFGSAGIVLLILRYLP